MFKGQTILSQEHFFQQVLALHWATTDYQNAVKTMNLVQTPYVMHVYATE